MEQNELISVIVPVFKVEKYLDRCVQSIVDQTYRNLEIILVDDGSPDNCPAMCDAWAKKDNRIKVIHKKNGGLSDARNAGMAIATGELMGFIDSDDYISPEMYQLLYEHMKADGSDIAACGVQMVWEDDTPPQIMTKMGQYTLDNKQALQSIVEESCLKHPVWNRLYRKSCVLDIYFPVNRIHEDAFWSYQVIARAKKESVIDSICYFYCQRTGSIMADRYSEKRIDLLDAYWNELEYVSQYSDIYRTAVTLFGFRLLYAYQCTLRIADSAERQKCKSRINWHIKNWRKHCMVGRAVGILQRGWYLLACISVNLTARLRNLLKVGI